MQASLAFGLSSCWRTGLAAPKHVESSWTRDWTPVPCIGRQIFNHWPTKEVQKFYLFFSFSLRILFNKIFTILFCYILPFLGQLHNSIFPKFWIFLSKELFQVHFTVFQRHRLDPWVGKIPWRRKFPWTEEPGGLQSLKSQRVGHDWTTEHTHRELKFFSLRESCKNWNKWKSEGAMMNELELPSHTVNSFCLVFKEICGLALPWWKITHFLFFFKPFLLKYR